MTHLLLFALFFVLFASRALGFDLGLAPGLSVKNAFLYLILATLAIELAITRRGKLELLPVFVPFAIYAIYAGFTVAAVFLIFDYERYSIVQALVSLKAGPIEHLLVLLIFFYGTTDSQRAMWVLRNMVWLIVIGNVVSVLDILNIVGFNVASEDKGGRLGGTIGSSNEFAYFLALFLPTIIAAFWTAKGAKKLLAGIGAFFSALAFLMAVSRGAVVGLITGSLLTAYYLRAVIPPKALVRAGFVALASCVVVVATLFTTEYGAIMVQRFGELGGSSYDASSGRTWIWASALNSMLEQPLSFVFGYGWNAYESAIQFRLNTHNTYLNILYNLGMVGVGLFLLTAVNAIRAIRAGIERAGPEHQPFLIAFLFGFVSLLVCIFFGGLYQSWMYVWAFVGVSLRIAASQDFEAVERETASARSDVALHTDSAAVRFR